MNTFGISDPPNISGTNEARIFKFGSEMNAKLGQKRSYVRHVTHFRNFGTPNISGINEARNYKFGKEMDGSEY